jgi:hypothetical protein
MVILAVTGVAMALLRWFQIQTQAHGSLFPTLVLISGALVFTALAGVVLVLAIALVKLARWCLKRLRSTKPPQ